MAIRRRKRMTGYEMLEAWERKGREIQDNIDKEGFHKEPVYNTSNKIVGYSICDQDGWKPTVWLDEKKA